MGFFCRYSPSHLKKKTMLFIVKTNFGTSEGKIIVNTTFAKVEKHENAQFVF